MDNYPDIDEAAHPLSQRVLRYSDIHEQLVKEAKKPGFSVEAWHVLADLVDMENFERVGTFKETIDWTQYTEMLTGFATSSTWEGTFKGITEVGNTVFLELEERCGPVGQAPSAVNTLSVFRFDEAGKLVHLDIYMQSPAFVAPGQDSGTGFRSLEAAS